MKLQTSPLKPKKLIKPKNVSGIKLSSVATSIKYRNRDDLMVMSMSPKTKVFWVFNKIFNRFSCSIVVQESFKKQKSKSFNC